MLHGVTNRTDRSLLVMSLLTLVSPCFPFCLVSGVILFAKWRHIYPSVCMLTECFSQDARVILVSFANICYVPSPVKIEKRNNGYFT